MKGSAKNVAKLSNTRQINEGIIEMGKYTIKEDLILAAPGDHQPLFGLAESWTLQHC